MAPLALVALVAACPFSGSQQNGDGRGGSDAPVCYGSFIRVCFPTAPAAAKTFTDAITVIDTDSMTDCDQQNDQKSGYCVVAGNGFVVASNQTLAAHGSKPLVLLSTEMFDMSGTIDVSSSRNGSQVKGPAADPAGCATGMPPVGSAGGYGASFGGKGGSGSEGNSPDGAGGIAAEPLLQFPSVLRGGCPGGSALTTGTLGEGMGGSGGGALDIIASRIHIDGGINASGAGGHGGLGNGKAGGGGGGSGGMIVIDSSMIQLDSRAAIWANGGGGAQGGASGMGGSNGNESSAPDAEARASMGNASGGNGGNGSVGIVLSGGNGKTDARSGGGGGGGGGGAGFIHAQGVVNLTIVSPPSIELPPL